MKKKKIIKGIILSVVAIVLVAAIVFGVSMVKQSGDVEKWSEQLALIEATPDAEVLAYFAGESDFTYDMSTYNNELSGADSKSDFLDSMGEEWVKSARDIPEDYQKLYDEANIAIIKYFNENFSVSVEEKLAVYEVKQMDIPSQFELDGGYAIGGNTSYFNSDNFTDPVSGYNEIGKMGLLDTYIHETVHYLGFFSTDDELHMMMEGFTVNITLDVLEEMGFAVDKTEETAYDLNKRLVRQLMIANKDIVKTIVASKDNNDEALYNELSAVLGEEKTKDLFKMHVILDYNFTFGQFSGDEEMLNIAQYLTTEYCKHFEPTDEQILEMHKYFIAPVSEI